MATFRLYPNGVTMGRGNPQPTGGKRGEVVGWSSAAVRRHKAWLYSVQGDLLTGEGDAVTLTMKHTPATSDEWTALLAAMWARLRRIDGYQRAHWVVEWQRRGTPHVHLAVYGDRSIGKAVTLQWLALTMDRYGSESVAQFVTPITGAVGWLQYLSKHASRGVQHYQRQGKPEGWTKTGRLWGALGPWPTAEPLQGNVNQHQYVVLRRVIRGWAAANARQRALKLGETRRLVQRVTGKPVPMEPDERAAWRAVKRLRRMHSTPDVGLSASRGVSEWVPDSVMLRLLEFVAPHGYEEPAALPA
jgi:hypothetical protein